MKEEAYRILAENQASHWWQTARRTLIEKRLAKLKMTQFKKALDVGCGTGYNCKFLAKFSDNVTGVDCSESAIDYAKEHFPDYQFIQGDANQIQGVVRTGDYDLATIFCVLYHSAIADDADVLKQVHSVLNPGGVIIITEPAFRILTRYHDQIDMGARRYRISEINSMLNELGFETLDSTYFGFFLFFPALLMALYDRILPSRMRETRSSFALEASNNSLVNSVMAMVMGLERVIMKMTGRSPLGVTLLTIARKP